MESLQENYFNQKRYVELDALRGIAALTVIIWHFFCATYTIESKGTKIFLMCLYYLVQGRSAVILFFILSGFVLSLPFFRESKPKYGAFVVRRVCRIYLPYLALLACTIMVRTFVVTKPTPGLSDWFNAYCGEPFSIKTVLEHLFLLGNIHSNVYNNTIWSLIHEMRISLVFPLLFLFVIRVRPLVSIAACVLLSGISLANEVLGWEVSNGWESGYFYSLHISSFFIIGILLAKHKDYLIRWYDLRKKAVKIILFIIAIILYRLSQEIWMINTKLLLISDYGTVFSVCFFMVAALYSGKFSNMLNKPIFKFFGNISYSVYLNHITVLYLSLYLLYNHLPVPVILLIYIVVAIIFSFITWKVIELPSILLGRKLSNKIKS